MFGGIGFLTWDDMHKCGLKFKKYRLQSKIALATTAVLIIVPALYFYCFEFSRPIWDEFSASDKVLASIFQSVTPRTAGFNTVNLDAMSEISQSIMIMLMLIGGSPASTAGGMKTTTAAVIIASMFSVFRRRNHAEAFRRRINPESVRSAAAVMSMYVVLFLLGGLTIAQIENLPVLDCFYETASAIGTVGLSADLTPHLTRASHVVLMLLMYIGRIGPLTMALVFAGKSNKSDKFRELPEKKIMLG